MTLKRRIIVLCIAGLVIAGVVAVYYMPQWQQTQAASKAGRRGGPPATDPVPVLATAARSRTCRSISTASAPRARSTP